MSLGRGPARHSRQAPRVGKHRLHKPGRWVLPAPPAQAAQRVRAGSGSRITVTGLPDPFALQQETGSSRPDPAPRLAPSHALWDAGPTPCWQDQGAGAQPGVTASRCERCWVGQPGGAPHSAFPACKSRSRIVLTWQQRHESCSGRDLASSAVHLPRPRVSWRRLLVGPCDPQPSLGTAPSPLPAVGPPSLPLSSGLPCPSPSPVVG